MSERLPPGAQKIISEYLQTLRTAGASAEDIAFAEEFLSGEPSAKSEDEIILDIKAAWTFVRHVHKRKGAKL